MEIVKKTEGNKATLEISGWLDTQTAPQLGEALSGLEDSITSLVFDFTNLEYISSAGLRQVIVAYKKMAQKDAHRCWRDNGNPVAWRDALREKQEAKT